MKRANGSKHSRAGVCDLAGGGNVRRMDRPQPYGVSVVEIDGEARIVLRGEIDSAFRVDAQRVLVRTERAGLPVVVDAGEVTFIDSSGLAFLLHLRKVVSGPVVLEDPSLPVLELLSAVGLSAEFTLRARRSESSGHGAERRTSA